MQRFNLQQFYDFSDILQDCEENCLVSTTSNLFEQMELYTSIQFSQIQRI